MRYILTVFLLTYSLFGANIDWPNNYEEALAQAKKENKLVYIFITSDSCRWCREFENTTLQVKEIKDRLHKEFVAIHLSRDRHTIPEQFKTAPVPRHYFTDAEGNILYASLGHRKVECFDSFMDNAQNKLKVDK